MYYIISKPDFEAIKISKEHALSKGEWEFLINGREIINKFFQVQQDITKADLGNGVYMDKEKEAYTRVIILEEMKGKLELMAQQVKEYEEKNLPTE